MKSGADRRGLVVSQPLLDLQTLCYILFIRPRILDVPGDKAWADAEYCTLDGAFRIVPPR